MGTLYFILYTTEGRDGHSHAVCVRDGRALHVGARAYTRISRWQPCSTAHLHAACVPPHPWDRGHERAACRLRPHKHDLNTTRAHTRACTARDWLQTHVRARGRESQIPTPDSGTEVARSVPSAGCLRNVEKEQVCKCTLLVRQVQSILSGSFRRGAHGVGASACMCVSV